MEESAKQGGSPDAGGEEVGTREGGAEAGGGGEDERMARSVRVLPLVGEVMRAVGVAGWWIWMLRVVQSLRRN